MAYSNPNAAYDLSLFDDDLRYSAAAPKRHRAEEEQRHHKKRQNRKGEVVQLPTEELNKIRRRKHNPFKIAAGAVGASIVTFVIGVIIVGQNQQIITAEKTLADTESIYIQNQMKVETAHTKAEIEKYATEVLGMTKASNAQKEFVALETDDKAEVSNQQDTNIFTRFFESLSSLWS